MTKPFFFTAVMISPVFAFAADTNLNLYRPFAETTKHVPVTIESTQKGSCNSQSDRIKREDAWHCVSERGVTYDPCFSKRFIDDQKVVCPKSPWTGTSVQLELNQRLDEHDMRALDISRTMPWAIELVSGEHCLSVASNQSIDGLPVNYRCMNGVELLGEAHRCSPVWTILRHDASGTSMAELASAWF